QQRRRADGEIMRVTRMLAQIRPADSAAPARLVDDVERNVRDFSVARQVLYRSCGSVHAAAGSGRHHDFNDVGWSPFGNRGVRHRHGGGCPDRRDDNAAHHARAGMHVRIVYHGAPPTNCPTMKSYWIVTKGTQSVIER